MKSVKKQEPEWQVDDTPIGEVENEFLLDDGAFEAWIDGICEDALLKLYREDPEKYIKDIKEWEKEHGRKIGTRSKEEDAYADSAWGPFTISV